MLVCNVSLLARRTVVAADIAEAVAAADNPGTGNIVFAILVDDPASVGETVDAYLGEIMREAASAVDTPSTGGVYVTLTSEVAAANSIQDATKFAVIAAATFDPATKTADVALSDANLTARHTVDGANGGVKAKPYLSSGKYYFEFTVIGAVGFFNATGLMTSSTDYVSFGVNGTNGIAVSRGGTISINAGGTGVTLGSFITAGDVCGIAIDLTAHLVWCRKGNGNWNNSSTANPATATGGLTFAAASLAPVVCFVSSSPVTDGYTANFGATPFANAAPSGFGAWPP